MRAYRNGPNHKEYVESSELTESTLFYKSVLSYKGHSAVAFCGLGNNKWAGK